jgi:hypothetical protein
VTHTSELEQSRVDAVREIASALCFAAADVLKAHGADPNSKPIMAAGFLAAIDEIDRKVVPNFKQALKDLL